MIGILGDVIRLKDYVLPLFGTHGLLVFLLKILYDPEKYPIEANQQRMMSFNNARPSRASTLMLEERKDNALSLVSEQDETINLVNGIDGLNQYEHTR